MPLLLFAAAHAKHDIPAAVQLAATAFPELTTHQLPHLACHPLLLELSALRYRQSLADAEKAGQKAIAASDTLLVLIGRGSLDETPWRKCATLPNCAVNKRRSVT